ncbi:hypothetical protein IAQ61_003983 [Plenodomus lingam]|uniref:uncharacterized protein n=1 Tax=Leptosphaeria maculans TaxID=5022 RepID=UPI003334757C|nr:hypothetical protein IAQ61_003983 [Plenodomus lingam]
MPPITRSHAQLQRRAMSQLEPSTPWSAAPTPAADLNAPDVSAIVECLHRHTDHSDVLDTRYLTWLDLKENDEFTNEMLLIGIDKHRDEIFAKQRYHRTDEKLDFWKSELKLLRVVCYEILKVEPVGLDVLKNSMLIAPLKYIAATGYVGSHALT